ncbi:MAG: hypothetical protein JW866_03870 [Ignavibacteriales bacterium]|nr:hypothetical protein [Ignavibacteriales bacterium]
MKNIYLFAVVLLSFILGCSREEKYEVFSSEAFAYKLPDGWELNTSAHVKDFIVNETNGIFTCDLTYYVDIHTPSGLVIAKADTGVIQTRSGDEFDEVPIDIQMELDDGFEMGIYKIVYFVVDKKSNQLVTDTTTFELSLE